MCPSIFSLLMGMVLYGQIKKSTNNLQSFRLDGFLGSDYVVLPVSVID